MCPALLRHSAVVPPPAGLPPSQPVRLHRQHTLPFVIALIVRACCHPVLPYLCVHVVIRFPPQLEQCLRVCWLAWASMCLCLHSHPPSHSKAGRTVLCTGLCLGPRRAAPWPNGSACSASTLGRAMSRSVGGGYVEVSGPGYVKAACLVQLSTGQQGLSAAVQCWN